MAHHLLGRSAYDRLTDRLNRSPQGAPPSDRLHAILALLFSEREADLVARLPIRPFTPDRAARIWKVPEAEARVELDRLADRGLLLDLGREEGTVYVLPPPMAGFFEFSMMRARGDLDQKALAELYDEYISRGDGFLQALFAEGRTQLGRTFVHEATIPAEEALRVLDHERASEVIRSARPIGISLCYCRHKKRHLGTACDAPLDICMTFGGTARSLIRHGLAREADPVEGLELLDAARRRGLVQFGENVRRDVAFLCHCCGCCCEAMLAARRFALMHPVHTTAFLPAVAEDRCRGCGRCAEACPVEAMTLVSAHDPRHRKVRRASLRAEACLGCGVCAAACDRGGIRMERRGERVITPVNGVHRAVLMAIERGKLQNLIFDQALPHHRALAAVLGAILRLPPVTRALASEQVRSRWLDRLLARA